MIRALLPILACLAVLLGGACSPETFLFPGDDASPDVGVESAAASGARDSAASNARDAQNLPLCGCASDNDCFLGSVCNPSSAQCVLCMEDTQCPPELSRCDQALGRCIQCGTPDDCAPGKTCVNRTCVPICGDGGSCPTSAPHCDPLTGACTQCASSDECAGFARAAFCATGPGLCVECVTDRQCQFPQRCNPDTYQCVNCLVSADCGFDEACDPTTSTCKSCRFRVDY